MSELVNLQKRVVNLQQFNSVVDPNFSTYTDEYNGTLPEKLDDTLQKFFSEYDRIFYQIPILGETQSHEYLVKQSSDLLNFGVETEEVSKLLQEIESLRTQLIDAFTTIEKLSK